MEILEAIQNRIRTDLAPFCDPGTSLSLTRSGRVLHAEWQQRRRDRQAEFLLIEPTELVVRFNQTELSYRSFFACEEMADIMGIAKTSLALHRNDRYIETRASINNTEGKPSDSSPAVDLIRQLVTDNSLSSRTSFVMVTGEAGAGKTWVLKELVSRQAREYLEGRARYVYLYVDAQGRALAKFNEALATELNELRVGLPYHAVAAMVRLGLIVPVVDGFDELIGVGGYDDAFSSISNFVEDLEGAGALVASARSTYYEQEFLERANRDSQEGQQAWALMSAKVLAWDVDERNAYIDSITGKNDPTDIRNRLNAIFSGSNADLAKKPLFFTRTTALLKEGEDLVGDGALTERLVDAFLARELKQKLLDKSGNRILEHQQLQHLCEDMAEEMWNQSTRELDRPTVKYIADVGLSDLSVPASAKGIVAQRMPSMAFLQPGDSSGSVRFEHEIFFDYFLSSRLAHRLEDRGAMTTVLLGRSAMPESLSDEVAKCVRRSGRNFSAQITTLSASAKSPGVKQYQVRENCGRLFGSLALAYAASALPLENFTAEEFVFPGSDLSGITIKDSAFLRCEMRRVNFANTVLLDCSFDGTVLEAPLISGSTQFSVTDLDPMKGIVGIRVVDSDGGIRTVYDPFEVRALLKQSGFSSISDDASTKRNVDSDTVHLVDKIARAFSKCNPISFEEYFDGVIASHRDWQAVRRAALSSGVLRSEQRQTHGPKKEFLRRTVRAEDIAAGLDRAKDVPESVRVFWDELEAAHPAEGV